MDPITKKDIIYIKELDEPTKNKIIEYGFIYGLLSIHQNFVLYYNPLKKFVNSFNLKNDRKLADYGFVKILFKTLKRICDDNLNKNIIDDLVCLAHIYGLIIYSDKKISGDHYIFTPHFFNYKTAQYETINFDQSFDTLKKNINYCQKQSPYYPKRLFNQIPIILPPIDQNQLVISNYYFLKKIDQPDLEYPNWRLNLNFYDGNPYYYNCCSHVLQNHGYYTIEIPKNVLFYYGITDPNNMNEYSWFFLTSYHRALIYANGQKNKILTYKTIDQLNVISLLDFRNYLHLFEIDTNPKNPFYSNKYNLKLFVKDFLLSTNSDKVILHSGNNKNIQYYQQTLNYNIHSTNEIFFYFLKKYFKKLNIDGIVIPKTYPNGLMTCADEGELVIFSKKKLSIII